MKPFITVVLATPPLFSLLDPTSLTLFKPGIS